MLSASPQDVFDETDSAPIARIDAQEESAALPVREYLESNGCVVMINELTGSPVTYHIAIGDADFVKEIFAHTSTSGVKYLGVVIGASRGYVTTHLDLSKKIVLVDPLQLTPTDVTEIMSFFFRWGTEAS